MQPYYQDKLCTIYCGDSREVIPRLDVRFDTLLTDPVWPNNSLQVFKSIDPYSLLSDVLSLVSVDRIVLHLGCDSDPRILSAVPREMAFCRVAWLRFAFPNYKGRLLNGSEVAYIFGPPLAASRFPGRQHLLPGESPTEGEKTCTQSTGRVAGHPCPRRLQHVQWLVAYFAGDSIIDPFCGSGTTLEAAKRLGRYAVGIEIEEGYCEIAARRLEQQVFDFCDDGEVT